MSKLKGWTTTDTNWSTWLNEKQVGQRRTSMFSTVAPVSSPAAVSIVYASHRESHPAYSESSLLQLHRALLCSDLSGDFTSRSTRTEFWTSNDSCWTLVIRVPRALSLPECQRANPSGPVWTHPSFVFRLQNHRDAIDISLSGHFSKRLTVAVWPPWGAGMWDTLSFICSQPLKPDPVTSMRALLMPEQTSWMLKPSLKKQGCV